MTFSFYFDKTVRVYNNNIRKGNYNNILVLAVVTIALLIIGLFNFINIYTVMMLKRAREFGVKKVYGAGAKDVFAQIFTENFILTGMALCISWCIIEITGGMMEHVLRIPQTSNTEFSATLSVGILILLPLLTSIYPFIRYNYVSPSIFPTDKERGMIHLFFDVGQITFLSLLPSLPLFV